MKRTFQIVCVVAVVVVTGHIASGGLAYKMTDLGYLSASDMRVVINNGGQVAWSDGDKMYRWTSGTGAEMFDLPGDGYFVREITNAGTVAGRVHLSSYYWNGGSSVTHLDAYPNSTGFTRVFGVNENGDFVGTARAQSGQSPPTVWRAWGNPQQLYGPSPLVPDGTATVINDSGLVGGDYFRIIDGSWARQACYWPVGSDEAIDIPYTIMGAGCINSSGTMGFYKPGNTLLLWTLQGGLQDAAVFPGASLVNARGINDSGRVAGVAHLSGWGHAFTWDPTEGLLYLPVPGTTIESTVHDINNSGDIVGWYKDASGFHAAAWQVIPEPATMTLLSLSGLALLRRRKRRSPKSRSGGCE